MTTVVTTQAELDAALASGARDVRIASPAGVWLRASGSATVWASGSAKVRAYDSATVWAYDSAKVRAYDSATVWAYGSAKVRAYDSATVWAYDSAKVRASDSATVRASDSAKVRAYDSATVWAYDSATVRAYDSATVWAYDSATVWAYDSAKVRASDSAKVRAYDSAKVRAYDSATVRAYDSATVWAYDSATVRAAAHVAVHRHSSRATVSGGVVIDLTALDLTDPQTWCDHHGAPVTGGIATVYKAVSATWSTDRGIDYSPGSLPACDDWRDDNECGGGLHFSPHPRQSRTYYPAATHYVAVGVALADLRPILGGVPKCKAPRVVVACREVHIDGTPR